MEECSVVVVLAIGLEVVKIEHAGFVEDAEASVDRTVKVPGEDVPDDGCEIFREDVEGFERGRCCEIDQFFYFR